jgi:hypothetical protein
MRVCILMLGNCDRRSREANIQVSIFKQSGLGLSASLVSGIDPDALRQLEAAVKSGTSIIVIDDNNLHTSSADKYLELLNNKYEIQYKITDKNKYDTPSGRKVMTV